MLIFAEGEFAATDHARYDHLRGGSRHKELMCLFGQMANAES
jgi:hypothetical protein